MKSKIISFFAVLLIVSSLSLQSINSVSAQESIAEIDGKLVSGRLLIPLRAVSENLGAKVRWDAKEKMIFIINGEKEIDLRVDSTEIGVDSIYVGNLDLPPKLYNNITYVPISYIVNYFGGQISWDNKLKQAYITYNDRSLIVNGKIDSKITLPSKPTAERVAQLYKKVEEAVYISKYAQKRKHFEEYFTSELINTVIADNGLKADGKLYTVKFTEQPYLHYHKDYPYSAVITQSYYPHSSEDLYPNDYWRNITLVFENGKWLVSDIITQVNEPRP